MASVFIAGFATLLFTAMLIWGFTSLFENEKRAAQRAFLFAIIIPAMLLTPLLLSDNIQQYVFYLYAAVIIITIIILLFPLHRHRVRIDTVPAGQIDERDIMFSRRLLIPGTERYEQYYGANPDKKRADDRFRKNPGLLERGSRFFNPFQFAAANASFSSVTALHTILDRNPAVPQTALNDASQNTRFIKAWAKKLGAYSVGITKLQKYHLYSHIGRGPDFGKKVILNHRYAIAFTVEMNKTMVDTAPLGPTVMESAQQYMNAGAIAVQIAEFIKHLGYPSRAHIDGNYRVVCPLVAKDAGLGVLGRMGLLMTPKLGPRVRIGVITTDLPLITEETEEDKTVYDFCARCKKCADVCPGRAISFSDPKEIDGVYRWQIDQEKCFTFWTIAGTDCARCISVCPYAHPDTLLHNLVRLGLKQSDTFQAFALKMDDLFYGRKPTPKKPDGYLTISS